MKVFVDGQYGTTGLKIHERLSKRNDVELLSIPEVHKKNRDMRLKWLNEADVVFLCLPDEASREAVACISNSATRIIDSSTAFRTDHAWTYGLPDLSDQQRRNIASSSRLAVPGCHATAFVLAVHPLVQKGILPRNYPVSCHSFTGYSGGGKPLIERYEAESTDRADIHIRYPQPYRLNLDHKHLPEMKKFAGLDYSPVFLPALCDFYNGMLITVPLSTRLLHNQPTAQDIYAVLSDYYHGEKFIKVSLLDQDSQNALDPTLCNGTNHADILVFGNGEQTIVACRLDNLGKGSSGAAIQCMNLMTGMDEGVGLPV